VVRRLAIGVSVVLMLASCAARVTPPPAPVTPHHPDFRYPTVPQGVDSIQVTRIERGWEYLQADNLRSAEREFQSALKLQPSFHPAETALGYLELARRDAKDAVARFDRALETARDYAPALVGRGQALLELGRDLEALASFEAALKADASLTDLQGRIEVLRFRALQDSLTRAKAATDEGRWGDARTAYREAVAASPESAFLYRELGMVERKAGDTTTALDYFRKAVALDAGDTLSQSQIAAILEAQGDISGALDAYEKVRAIDPSAVPADRVERLRELAALEKLPAEYRAIPSSSAATRADVAALIGVRLAPMLAQARPRQAVVTDVRGHWAQQWITSVVRAGVMDAQPNYTFQPRAGVRRGDLAQTVARVLNLVAAEKPDAAKKWQTAQVTIADVPQGHLSYPAVSQAIASGVMPLEDGAFQLLRPVTGAEVVDIIARLEALARP